MRTTPAVSAPPVRAPVRSTLPFAVLVLALSAALLLGSCGSGTDDPPGAGTGTATQGLEGRTFVVSDLDSDGHEIVPGSTIRLRFGGGRVEAYAGCNSMSGEVTVEDGRLVVDSLETTEMGCEPALMEQESWVAAFLTAGPTTHLSGAALTLTTARATVHLEEEVVADHPVAGTVWRLESLLDGQGADGTASSPPRKAAQATLRIEDGSLAVDTGCNTGSANVEYADGVLRADGLVTTLRDCGPAMRDLEQRFEVVLTPPTAYEVEGRSLILWAPDGRTGLGFRAG